MVLEHGSWSAARNRWVLAVRGGLACAGWGVSQTCCGAVFFGSLLYTTPGPGYMCIVLEPDILLCLICAQQSISLLMDHPAKQVSSWLQGCRSVVSTVTISQAHCLLSVTKVLKRSGALAQAAQRCCGCPIPGVVQGQVGGNPGQPDLMLDLAIGNPAHGNYIGSVWALRPLPT